MDNVNISETGKTKPVSNEPLEKPLFNGEVLLCEDNIMNQQVICEHLSRVGLKTVVAENGKIGVDLVKEKTGRQFDLVLMDIYMPVMDGLEATSLILKVDPGIPVVAVTANVTADDRDTYYSTGMKDVVGKPFTSQELWRCLMKYLEPVKFEREDTPERLQGDNDLHKRLIMSFLRNNIDIYDRIKNSLDENDIKLAHRLAHTLKSNAGQLDKIPLQEAAKTVEEKLTTGVNHVTAEHLEILKSELDTVFAAFESITESKTSPDDPLESMDTAAAIRLLDELEPLIRDSNYESVSFLDKLRCVNGSEPLIGHIENLDFRLALESLMQLRKKAAGEN